MSTLGRLFGNRQDDSESEEELTEEDETPQAFQVAEPASQEPEPDPLGLAAMAEAEAEDSSSQEEQGGEEAQAEEKQWGDSREEDLMELFGTTGHEQSDVDILTSDLEDVPVHELVADLRDIAAALTGGSLPAEERGEEAA